MQKDTAIEIAQLRAKVADLEQKLAEMPAASNAELVSAGEAEYLAHDWTAMTGGLLYVAEIGPDGQLSYHQFPPYFENLTGYSVEMLQSKPTFWLDEVVHEEHQANLKRQLTDLPEGIRDTFSYRLVRPGGTVIWVSDSVICSANDVKVGRIIYGAITEITAHKEAENVLAEILAETQVLYDVSRMLGGISTVEDGLTRLLDVLNKSEAVPPADGIQLYRVEVESNGAPSLAELSASVNIADRDVSGFTDGTRFTLADSPMIEPWFGRTPTPLFFTDLQTDDRIDQQMRARYLENGIQTVVLIPLYLTGRWVGLLDLYWLEPQQFTDLSLRLYQALMNQLAIALDNIRLFEQAQQRAIELVEMTKTMAKRATELETVAQVSATATTHLEPKGLLQEAVNLTKSRFDLYHVHIYLLNERKDVLYLAVGAGEVGEQMVAEGRDIVVDQKKSLVARAVRDREPIIINDVRQDPGFLPHPLLPDTKSEMALPMSLGTEVLGVLDVQSDTIDRFDENDVRVHTTLAAQIAVALTNARLWERAEASMIDMQRLATIVENQRDFMGICDRNGVLKYVNPAGQTMLGLPIGVYDQADISILDFFDQEDAEHLMTEGVAQAQSEGAWSSEIEIRSLHEKIIPVEQSITINYDNQLRPEGFNLIMHDITERKLAEAERERLLAEVNIMVSQFITQQWFEFLGERHDGHWWIESQKPGMPLDVEASSLDRWRDLVIETGKLEAVPASTENDNRHNAAVVAPIPLRGHVVGSISLETVHPDRHWNEDELALIEAISEQLGLTLENLRLFEQMGHRATRERIIATLTQQIWASGEIEQILEKAVVAFGETFAATKVVIKLGIRQQLLADDESEPTTFSAAQIQTLTDVEQAWLNIQDKVETLGYTYTKSGTEAVATQCSSAMKKAIIDRDLIHDSLPETNLPSDQSTLYLAVPIMFRDQVIGVIELERDPSERWSKDELLTIQAVIEQTALALDAARLARERTRAAWRDNVVGESTAEVWAAAEIDRVMQTAIAQLGDRLDVSEVVIQLNDKMSSDTALDQ